MAIDFDRSFQDLTGHPPFPWQRALFHQFCAGSLPARCDIPTGLGKTSVIAVWLLALADRAERRECADFPRRLVYVVNRRTVVDQATREAERLRAALTSPPLASVSAALESLAALPADGPVAISTLRGQFADNAEWRADPARPAVVVGTIDMVGSRLLFSGYGRGFKSRPLHAGFLGQDVLLVHDEAHLEPAFQELVSRVKGVQQEHDFRPMRVMALSATSRPGADVREGTLRLTDADWENEVAARRLHARKRLSLIELQDGGRLTSEVARLALKYADSGQAILVFLRRLEDVDAVAARLRDAAPGHVQTLTGTLRGLERDRLASRDPVFARFAGNGDGGVSGTVYLVCTSAGEVGVDMSADHMVCDLAPFDSLAQRLGRVNRFGEGDATVDVVWQAQSQPGRGKSCAPTALDDAVERTRALVRRLPVLDDRGRYDASPAGLLDLPEADRLAAFSPPPVVLTTTDILLDAWALTTCTGDVPGRPPVADWLHGETDWEPPATFVGWREEVDLLNDELAVLYEPEELLADFPLEPHELLRDQTSRIRTELETLAGTVLNLPVWVVRPDDSVQRVTVGYLVEQQPHPKSADPLAHCMVLLSPLAGGLKDGRLDGTAAYDPTGRTPYDICCEGRTPEGEARRQRVWDTDPRPEGMRLVRSIDTRPNAETEVDGGPVAVPRVWRWYVRPRAAHDEDSRNARRSQQLGDHAAAAERVAEALTERLGLARDEAAAVSFAARHHDDGKARDLWQRAVGNAHYPGVVWAKSGGASSYQLSGYRHEFGSLGDVQALPELAALSPDARELSLHLIAVHHGRARPHFPEPEVFDPCRTTEATQRLAREVPQRFARLQRKYGRWGLAWLESLVRAADAAASRAGDERPTGLTDRTAPTHGGEGRP